MYAIRSYYAAASDYSVNGGSLLKVTGTVTQINESSYGIQSFLLKDESGTAVRIFMDGYIGASTGTDQTASIVSLGNTVITSYSIHYTKLYEICILIPVLKQE